MFTGWFTLSWGEGGCPGLHHVQVRGVPPAGIAKTAGGGIPVGPDTSYSVPVELRVLDLGSPSTLPPPPAPFKEKGRELNVRVRISKGIVWRFPGESSTWSLSPVVSSRVPCYHLPPGAPRLLPQRRRPPIGRRSRAPIGRPARAPASTCSSAVVGGDYIWRCAAPPGRPVLDFVT
ncbi:hypothetical protein J6590_032815 [Homalodisca vitripennis]|nr:hypothetical protein J6590_032815 [Homalodisca vitripennis]